MNARELEALEADEDVADDVEAGEKKKAKKGKKAKPTVKGKKSAKANTKAGNGKKGKVEKKSTKPKKEPAERDIYGFRKGSLKSKAAEMYAGKKGATLSEVKAKLNSSQLNLLAELENRGFTITKTKEPGKGKKQVTRYKLSGTGK